eukprot:Blabericola_migrator_1__7977@NODE_4093_length_1336_cov_25_196217_g2527_i0_p1_GENE_NODE_4093_length_1336_cov_25_196217_g2527_i0NODE_4093_length_1336_cov_25_196217_g2527_i0_p1_ORF_typecomplete_len240_score55_14_NODE_4093_length_1336_cov_25_196217_g2527_i03521071
MSGYKMTCPRSVFPQKSSELQNAKLCFEVLTAILPSLPGAPNTGEIHFDSNTDEEQPEGRYNSLASCFNNPDLISYFQAAVKAAAKQFVSMSTQPSPQAESEDLVSILVECLKRELKGVDLSPESKEAVESVLSDEDEVSTVREWTENLMSSNWGSTLSIAGLLSALPLASGASEDSEFRRAPRDASWTERLSLTMHSLVSMIEEHPFQAAVVAVWYVMVLRRSFQILRQRQLQREDVE